MKKNRGGDGDNENLDEGADTKATTYTITINPTRHYIKTTASVQFVASGTISGRCSLGSSISGEVTSGSRYSISFSANASGSPDLRCSPSSASGTANSNKSISVSVAEYFTLSYSSGGGSGSMSSQSAMYTGFYYAGSCSFYRTNYVFSHWRGSDGNTYNPGNSIRVTGDFTLTAVWTYSPPPVYYYDVTYSGNGATSGSTSGHYDVEEDTYITIRSCGFTKTGYTFVEWNTNSSGTGTSYDPGDRYRVDYDEVFYAIWKINTYTVSFNGNGATSGSMSSQTKTYGVTLTLRANTYVRTGYNFLGWSTSSTATTATWSDRGSYTNNASNTLYAVWEAKVIPVSLNTNGGSGGTSTIYLKYDSGWYSNSSCTSSITSITKPTRTGWTFNGYNTVINGTGTTLIDATEKITASDTFYSTDGTKTIYAQWIANNPAYYDNEGGYWYIENGMMPQKKVTDSGMISGINSSFATGTTYYFAGLSLQSKVYGGKEYCQYNGNWYEVMPIRWRLVYLSSQTTGYGTETDTLAVMAEIVYVDAFSDSFLGVDMGYSSESVTELKKNQIDSTYLLTETKSMPTFGSTSINGTPTSVSSNIFVASYEDISNFATNANGSEKLGSIRFSDLAKDYLLANGKDTIYFTRDLGTNYNNIFCMNANGDRMQYKANNYLGIQFSIVVTEYACV